MPDDRSARSRQFPNTCLAHDVGDRSRGIEIAIRSRVLVLGDQLHLIADIRSGYDKFCTCSRSKLNAGLAGVTSGRERIAVNGVHLHRLSRSIDDVLQVEDGMGGRVDDPPKLL